MGALPVDVLRQYMAKSTSLPGRELTLLRDLDVGYRPDLAFSGTCCGDGGITLTFHCVVNAGSAWYTWATGRCPRAGSTRG